MTYRVNANLHIIAYIEADSAEEAKQEFRGALEYDGELWDDDIDIEEYT